jgi:hypothetical protein
MTRVILVTLAVMISIGCSGLKPAVGTQAKPEKPEKPVVERTEAPEIRSEKPDTKVKIQSEEKKINPEEAAYTISDLGVSEKNNGVLISMNFLGNDPKENIKTFFSGDSFFNITFYKGKFSGSVKNFTYNKSVVRSVKFFEFKDSVQITFRLKKDYNSAIVSTDKKKVMISVFN